MKPASFDYDAPHTVGEVVALLGRHGDDAEILAGGQSLVPLLNFRLARPARIIDVNRTEGLAFIGEEDGALRLGATTRQRDVETSDAVRRHARLLQLVTPWVGHRAIRARGTIGGSVAHNDPAAEYPAALLALDASVTVAGPRGEREVSVDDLLGEWLSTTLEVDELITAIRVPSSPATARYGIAELARRPGDFAISGVVVVAHVATDGRVSDTRIVGFGGLPRATRLTGAEDVVRGRALDDSTVVEAGRAAAASVDPTSDIHATSQYRKHLTGVLTTRALRQAASNGEA